MWDLLAQAAVLLRYAVKNVFLQSSTAVLDASLSDSVLLLRVKLVFINNYNPQTSSVNG